MIVHEDEIIQREGEPDMEDWAHFDDIITQKGTLFTTYVSLKSIIRVY